MRNYMLTIAILIVAVIPIAIHCPIDNDSLQSAYKGIDFESGCTCREYINSYATCYGTDDCIKFPRKFKTNLKCFRFATTGAREIIIGHLKNFHHLTSLYIEANLNLVKIESGVFKYMSNLRNLSISYNPKLLKLEEDVFEGLTNLEFLSLGRNGFDNIKDFAPSLKASYMPKLRKIDLKEVNCPVVNRDDFINLTGSKLERINLVDSQIEYIHPDALTHLKYLKALSLGENSLNATTVINLLRQMTRKEILLNELNLRAFGFKKQIPVDLLSTIGEAPIRTLIVAKNQFDILHDDSFPTMPNIELINLNDCLIMRVSLNAFSNFPNLKSLILSKNKFTFIPNGVLIPMLEELDLSINTWQSDIQSYFTLEKMKFVNMTNLKILNLRSNNMRKVPREAFIGLRNLRHLDLEDCTIFFIEDRSFGPLENLEYLNLATNIFPNRRFNRDIFYGLKKLKHLSLANCKIKCIPNQSNIFEHLVSLEKLDLSSNLLHEINPALVLPIRKLTMFNISMNLLTAWPEQMFTELDHIATLIAFDNKLTSFTHEMLIDFSKLKEIDISKNIFTCDCPMIETFDTLPTANLNHVLQLFANSSSPTKCLGSEKYYSKHVHEFYKEMHKPCEIDSLEKVLHYIIPSVICLIIIILVAILSYVYRWHIRYWMFLTKLSLTRRAQFHKRRNIQCQANYLYDAFVSYSNEDRNFVIRLVSMLENYEPFLKLCVYERDFEIGTIISESVLECVSMSRKTLLIISNSYIKSQWCTWEAQVAEHHRLFFENEHGECVNDSIVMIKLGNISSNNISPMLKYLMKTRIYLQWDPADNKQKHFWDKLRNALAPSEDDKRVNAKV